MARFRYLEREQMPEGFALLVRDRPLLNLFRILANAPGLAEGLLGMGAALRNHGELEPRLKELVILRVGAISRAGYEMHQHRRLATDLGLSTDEIAAAVREGPDDMLTQFEHHVLKFVDAVTLEVKAPRPLFDAVAAELTDRQMIELILLTGYYTMICRFLENAEVDIEAAA